jgi:hypothetical protein
VGNLERIGLGLYRFRSPSGRHIFVQTVANGARGCSGFSASMLCICATKSPL